MSDQAAPRGLRHCAWFYRSEQEHLAGIEDFVRTGVAAGEPVLVAIPHSEFPPGWHSPDRPDVIVVDMAEIGLNPARVIPLLQEFLLRHAGQSVRCLDESAWRGRSAAELGQAARHEALVNLAFAASDIRVLCPYNARALPQPVLSEARSTHPWLLQDGTEQVSQGYVEPEEYLSGIGKPLVAPATAQSLTYDHDLRPVRALVAAVGQTAGLSPSRCTDLVIAANEVAANTLQHTAGAGVARAWSADHEVLCQIEDGGYIANPLAGYWRQSGELPGGQGLWLVNQVCDLTEIVTSRHGTTIRLHMSL